MSDYRRMEFPKYGFNIFKYRGYYYFEFTKEPDHEMLDEMERNGFYYRDTNVHGAEDIEKRWSRSSSENGRHGMKICVRSIIDWEDNKSYSVSDSDYSYEKNLEDYFFN